MRSRNVRVTALLVASAVVVAIGSAIAAEGDGKDEAVAAAAGDEALVDQLLALEAELPAPLPSSASLEGTSGDVVLTGSFTTARSTFDRVEEGLRQLYVSASDAGTAVADAIADVTRGLLVERQAVTMLEDVDDSGDARPIDASDATSTDGLAIDADGEVGATQVAAGLLLQARDTQRAGYAVLAAAEGIEGGSTFQARYDALVAYRDEVEVVLSAYAGVASDQLLVATGRFDAPVGVPAATSTQYACVDRALYESMEDSSAVERIVAAVEEPDAECAAAARRAGLALVDQEALQEQLLGTSGAAAEDDAQS